MGLVTLAFQKYVLYNIDTRIKTFIKMNEVIFDFYYRLKFGLA